MLSLTFSAPLLLVICLSAVAGAVVVQRVFSSWNLWKVKRRRKRGLAVERFAPQILRRYGYRMEREQPPLDLSMTINGSVHSYQVRPDGFAKRGGKRYVVEIKSGSIAPNPLYKETRRQMLEYYYGCSAQGVLLVNIEKRTVQLIQFGKVKNTPEAKNRFLFGLLSGLAFSLIVYFLFLI